jgi:aminopeptidase N
MSGLGRYVKSHAYGNSNYTDLWASFAAAAGEPLEEYMSVWTLRR